jgi:transposase
VTVIIDLTGIRDGTGPARLLDMVQGRSKQAFKTWLSQRPKDWRDGIEVVAMDGFTGFKTATTEELPDAVTVMDPFHVVRLAGDALDHCSSPAASGPDYTLDCEEPHYSSRARGMTSVPNSRTDSRASSCGSASL